MRPSPSCGGARPSPLPPKPGTARAAPPPPSPPRGAASPRKDGGGAGAPNRAAGGRASAVKGRPRGHPLIVHLGDGEQLDEWAVDVPASARRLAKAFWPGPLTVLVHRAAVVPDLVTGGRPTVGL